MPAPGNRGAITADGCPVEVYRVLPDRGEAEFVHHAIKADSLILDLGAGTGRIADALVARGHRVVAVDSSADMLACVRRAEPVQAGIETYRDSRRFDAVLLASHLINTPDDNLRRGLLDTVAQHLHAGSIAFVQWHVPEWFDGLIPGAVHRGTIGTVGSSLRVLSYDAGLLDAAVTYELGEETWTQPFSARRLTVTELAANLHRSGLELVRDEPLHDDWVLARVTAR